MAEADMLNTEDSMAIREFRELGIQVSRIVEVME